MRRRWTVGVLEIAVAAQLGGCVATETAVPASSVRGVAVSGPPPAPLAEATAPGANPGAPNPGAVWVTGYWHWTGMQYTWIPGHWENAPPGTAWAAPRYVRAEGGYFYEAGGWKPTGNQTMRSQGTANALR